MIGGSPAFTAYIRPWMLKASPKELTGFWNWGYRSLIYYGWDRKKFYKIWLPVSISSALIISIWIEIFFLVSMNPETKNLDSVVLFLGFPCFALMFLIIYAGVVKLDRLFKEEVKMRSEGDARKDLNVSREIDISKIFRLRGDQKEKLEITYSKEELSCRNCGSNDITIYSDASGYCNSCKKTYSDVYKECGREKEKS
jgi:hypothetical protein